MPMRKLLRRLLFVVMLLTLVAGLTAVFYIEENWRGARAWAECQRELAARGESVDWEKFVPPAVPDEQNFAMAPLFAKDWRTRSIPRRKRW